MMTLLRRLHQDIQLACRARNPLAKVQSAEMYGNMSNTRLGTTNKSGLFAAKLFESYRVGIVNLGLFSLKGTLHQIPNPL
jgi:hypothetical protein